jgi:hypothetical protein
VGQAITVSYVGAAGRKLLAFLDYSQPLIDFPTTTTEIAIQRNLGKSSYQALQLQYQLPLRRGLQILASYTLARAEDNATQDESGVGGADLLAREYGPSDFDVRHVLSTAVTYDLPRLSGPALVRGSLNGWGLDLLVRYQSAFPVSPTTGARIVSPSGARAFSLRPDLVQGQPLYVKDATVPGGRRFNRAAFQAPASNQQGNFLRNGLRGFPASEVDLALRREFKLRESVKLQLRAELFNVFNHPNFGSPVNTITDPLFGQPKQMLGRSLGGLNALYQMGGPRSGQLAIKLIF